MGVTEAVAAVVTMKAAALVAAAVQVRANCDVALHSAEQLVE